ncbi:Sensory box histidine kinase/response regulator [Myxococcus hansupus]|uniref:histidine kinase n=1 Tax=Pseudomyxococcus hansupus TaxID=1297742 RepID=A0A0H4WP84_9BACT|nr:PAS domain-containing protein [Myxococcus hansupus]AKQ63378.1 Sensory box histidine kinase/response regulator [Myxococcus hansupus]
MTSPLQELTGSATAALVREEKELVLQRWRQRVLRDVYAAGERDRPSLMDALPGFLEYLAVTVEANALPPQRTAGVAREHEGEGARASGCTLDQVIFEYQVLREVLVETLEARGRIAPRTLRRLHAAVDQAIREAAVQEGIAARQESRVSAARTAAEAEETMRLASIVQSEKEELTRQVRTSEAHLRLVMDALPVLISFVDAQERYGFVNKAYEEWFGLPREALLGRTLIEVIGPAAYAVLGPYVKRGLAGEHFTFEQHGVPYRLGGTRDVRVSFTPLYDDAGQPDGYVAMLQDVSLQNRLQRERDVLLQREATARAEAESARAQLAKFVETAPSAMGSVRGPHHVFEMVNPKYHELMGTHRPLLGRAMAEAAPEVIAQGYIQLFDTVYRTGEPYAAEAVPARLDRQGNGELEEVYFNLAFQPVHNPAGQVEGVDIFGFEVTSQVRLRQREEELKRLAEERSAFEQQLIGIVSHDLRNPLAAILFATSAMAANAALDERSAKSVLRISSAAERANRMVKDLLDFTQARLGKGIPIYPRPLDLSAAIAGWVEEVRAAFPLRDVNIQVQGDGHAPVDPDRMAQVVGNLVFNALKYSPPDSAVDVRLRGEPQEVVLEVHNHGTPIPEEQQAHLFQPLERGQGERDMASRSVGLGLFIVKHVVEAHHGRVELMSSTAAGTTFTVHLPR